MSMRKIDDSATNARGASRVRVGHTHAPDTEAVPEMPTGVMDGSHAAAGDGGGMPRGDMATAQGFAADTSGPAGGMPVGAMEAPGARRYAGGNAEMPAGEMNGSAPRDGDDLPGGEMPPAREGMGSIAGAAPFALEVGGEWRLTLTAAFARPSSG